MESTYGNVVSIALLGVLAAGAAWIAFVYQRDIGRARARVATGSRVIRTPYGPIEYAEAGSGPPILVIHGAGGGFDQGLALASPFANKGYRVIAMSRFGYLRTAVPKHPSIALQADAHACLLDTLGVERAAVMGLSAGAPSALEFALRHRERCTALVLLVPGWYPSPTWAPRLAGPIQSFVYERILRSDFAFWAFSKFLRTIATRTVLGTPPEVVKGASANEQRRIAQLLQDISPLSQRQGGLSLEEQLTVESLSKPLESISVPTLAISTEDDLYGTYENAEFITNRVPGARFVGFHTGGHMCGGHNDEVLDAIATFLHEHHTDLSANHRTRGIPVGSPALGARATG